MDGQTPDELFDLSAFARDGFVLGRRRLDDERIGELRAAFDKRIANHEHGPEHETDLGLDWRDPLVAPFLRVLQDDALLDAVASICGTPFAAMRLELFGKRARSATAIPWHQDTYTTHVGYSWSAETARDQLHHPVTLWLALDDVSTANGGMEIVAGRHRELLNVNGMVPADALRDAVPTEYRLSAGQCGLHHPLAPHRSVVNSSGSVRRAFLVRFVPCDSAQMTALCGGPPAQCWHHAVARAWPTWRSERRYAWAPANEAALANGRSLNRLYVCTATDDDEHAPAHTPAHAPAYAPAHTPAYAPAHAPAHTPAHAPAYAPAHTPAHAPAYAPANAPAHAPAYAPAHTPAHAPAYAPAHAPAHAPAVSSAAVSSISAPAPATPPLASLHAFLEREGMGRLRSAFDDDECLEPWLGVLADGRPKLLAALRARGVAQLADRQSMANALGREERTRCADGSGPAEKDDALAAKALAAAALVAAQMGAREMHEVRPRLWLGSVHAASDVASLRVAGVTHVLSVGEEPPRVLSSLLASPGHLMRIDVQDEPTADLSAHFEATSAFVSRAIAAGGSVLVHCMAGQSRSATVVAAHLVRTERLSAARALAEVQARRLCVQPNHGFVWQLGALATAMGTEAPA